MAGKCRPLKDATARYNKTPATLRHDSLTNWEVYADHEAPFDYHNRGSNRPQTHFPDHVLAVASNAARKISCVRCASHFLDADGCSTLLSVSSSVPHGILSSSMGLLPSHISQ